MPATAATRRSRTPVGGPAPDRRRRTGRSARRPWRPGSPRRPLRHRQVSGNRGVGTADGQGVARRGHESCVRPPDRTPGWCPLPGGALVGEASRRRDGPSALLRRRAFRLGQSAFPVRQHEQVLCRPCRSCRPTPSQPTFRPFTFVFPSADSGGASHPRTVADRSDNPRSTGATSKGSVCDGPNRIS